MMDTRTEAAGRPSGRKLPIISRTRMGWPWPHHGQVDQRLFRRPAVPAAAHLLQAVEPLPVLRHDQLVAQPQPHVALGSPQGVLSTGKGK